MNPPKGRILCIEDNPVNWRLVQRLLAQAGYEMHWAEEGLRGFEMALELKPDLILLDINLPGLSGFEVATKLRQHKDIDHVPVVALTAKTQKSDRETALVAGCSGFISKPIDPFTFVDQVAAYLLGRRDRVEESREGEALRQFSHQVVEHLEAQLRDAQEANQKLMDAQAALEVRNRSLSRLLNLSRAVLAEHDETELLRQALQSLGIELGLSQIAAYWMDPSGGYLEGMRWSAGRFDALPPIPADTALPSRLSASGLQSPLLGEELEHSRFWDDGVALGLWAQPVAGCLLPLRGSSEEQRFSGFLAMTRPGSAPFQPAEAELVALHGGMAQAGLENAGLIASLSESSRALAESYERLEGAFQELQVARVALGQKERQAVLVDLFLNMAQRLERPVAVLAAKSAILDRFEEFRTQPDAGFWKGDAPDALQGIQAACAQMDVLVKALLRRAGKDSAPTPEWLNLHEIITQELLFLDADGTIPEGVDVGIELQAEDQAIFGVYSDFAEILGKLVAHAMGGPDMTPSMLIRTTDRDGRFHLEVLDEGGAIPPERLDSAFEPFTVLHGIEPVLGVRSPGEALPGCAQILAAYQGSISIRNEGDGTLVMLELPLR